MKHLYYADSVLIYIYPGTIKIVYKYNFIPVLYKQCVVMKISHRFTNGLLIHIAPITPQIVVNIHILTYFKIV